MNEHSMLYVDMITNPCLEPGPWALCNIGYPSEMHIQLKSRQISLVLYKIRFRGLIVLWSCSAHDSVTAVLCKKIQNDFVAGK